MAESDELRRQILENMELRSTEELKQIWHENDRAVWSAMAFDVIGEILQRRTGQLPSQENYEEKLQKARLAQQTAEEETYYSLPRVEKVATMADIAAWVVLAGYLIDWGLHIYDSMFGLNMGNLGILIQNIALVGIGNIISGIYVFVILKAIAQAIYILVDIEENTHLHSMSAASEQKGQQ